MEKEIREDLKELAYNLWCTTKIGNFIKTFVKIQYKIEGAKGSDNQKNKDTEF